MFVGIRQMANLPVESMKTGGTAWFIDLTIPDPYFVLPFATVALLYATIEVSVVSNSTQLLSSYHCID